MKVPGLSNVCENDSPIPRKLESHTPLALPGNVPPEPEVLVWAMFPSFIQRIVSPTEMEIAKGLKNPTHGLGCPSHPATAPTETTRVVGAWVVVVVDEVEVVVEAGDVVVDDVVVDVGDEVVVEIGGVVVVGAVVVGCVVDEEGTDVVVVGVDPDGLVALVLDVVEGTDEVEVEPKGSAFSAEDPEPHDAATNASESTNPPRLA